MYVFAISNIYVTEDFSRKVRKHREELLKFAREIRSKEPHLRCSLQYDRLYVENDIYLYNEVQERVEKVLMKVQAAKGYMLRIFVFKHNNIMKDNNNNTDKYILKYRYFVFNIREFGGQVIKQTTITWRGAVRVCTNKD